MKRDSQATHTASSMSCESDCFSDSHRRSGDHSPQSLRHEGMLTTNMEGILDDGQPHTPLHCDGDPATPGLEDSVALLASLPAAIRATLVEAAKLAAPAFRAGLLRSPVPGPSANAKCTDCSRDVQADHHEMEQHVRVDFREAVVTTDAAMQLSPQQ
ncbi:hypothetical protein QBZ16_005287 [Prototheca wickerhamii]|uniref:Uncharacterized protein n=1 Tax=Prototheca wickerhamii TaxID=3111 RepID=A0AAD9II03_PROWI|nr:hypothetical protein QBZ16_005287 [Prototheca wickerhamii]